VWWWWWWWCPACPVVVVTWCPSVKRGNDSVTVWRGFGCGVCLRFRPSPETVPGCTGYRLFVVVRACMRVWRGLDRRRNRVRTETRK
jgi:hypothetical protein